MTDTRNKSDRPWLLSAGLVAMGAALILVGFGLDIREGDQNALGRLLAALGMMIGLAGVDHRRNDRKERVARDADAEGRNGRPHSEPGKATHG